MLADRSQLIVLALKTQNLARLYGKRNVRAGVMLAETSRCQSYKKKDQNNIVSASFRKNSKKFP